MGNYKNAKGAIQLRAGETSEGVVRALRGHDTDELAATRAAYPAPDGGA